jgi:hypothetical protein
MAGWGLRRQYWPWPPNDGFSSDSRRIAAARRTGAEGPQRDSFIATIGTIIRSPRRQWRADSVAPFARDRDSMPVAVGGRCCWLRAPPTGPAEGHDSANPRDNGPRRSQVSLRPTFCRSSTTSIISTCSGAGPNRNTSAPLLLGFDCFKFKFHSLFLETFSTLSTRSGHLARSRSRRCRSLAPNVGGLYDRPPFLNLVPLQRRKCLGRLLLPRRNLNFKLIQPLPGGCVTC